MKQRQAVDVIRGTVSKVCAPSNCPEGEGRVMNRLFMLLHLCILNARTQKPSLAPMERLVLSLVPRNQDRSRSLHRAATTELPKRATIR